jgi:transposase
MLIHRSDLPFLIHRIRTEQASVVLEAEGTAVRAACPDCAAPTETIHDRYQRKPLDLPWRGRPARLVITVRRFVCANPDCARRTFAEDFGTALPRRAQRTAQATATLLQFGQKAGGELGCRLAGLAGLPTSPDTVLRIVRRSGVAAHTTPRVLGVDDLALRRGTNYATLFINMETHRPIDLLKGREAETLAEWLRARPGIEIIVRDRSEAYAQGARDGAPAALQVADRFHLVQNASAALAELLRGRRRNIESAEESTLITPTPPVKLRPLSPSKRQQLVQRAARVARWQQVKALDAGGASHSQIARELGIDRKTVARFLATVEAPRNQGTQRRPSDLSSPSLAPYVEYLQGRWQAGCQNLSQLYREIKAQGYTRSRSLVAQALLPWRETRQRAGVTRKGRRMSVRWLCLRPPSQLKPHETAALERLLESDEDLASGYQLLQRFRMLVERREIGNLDDWLQDAGASHLAPFVSLANGLRKDYSAVAAALTTPWSSGPVEGHVNRVKLIKRQGYGRASLELLRCRVLAA